LSFSSDIKEELNKANDLVNKEWVKYELIGYLISGNANLLDNKNIKFSTESDYNINRFSKLLSNLQIHHKIDIIGKTFFITLKIKDIPFMNITLDTIYINNEVTYEKEENRKATIRGMFMGAGSVNNPENDYHLEILLSNQKNLEFAITLLKSFNIYAKKLITNHKFSIYIKEGEEVSKFLALIGASRAVMLFEDIRIKREMRGKVNRLVNCEAANLNKTINASIEQIAAIEKLKKTAQFNKLDENLKEIALLRLQNPNMSLIELGNLLNKPLGKSGVNYRLKKIIEIAKDIK